MSSLRMRIRSPSLTELHAFVAVVECNGFSRAAQRLAVTQGAVSRAVLRLEARLGQALLDRGTDGVRPNAHGEVYYARVKPALEVLEEAVGRAGAARRDRDVVRLSVITSLNMRWLVPRLPDLARQHPWLKLQIRPYRADGAYAADDVDAWIDTRTHAGSRWPRHIQATYLVGREIVLVCHPDRTASLRQPGDVLAHSLLHHEAYPGNWSTWAQANGVDPAALRLGPGFDLAAALIEAVVADLGIAVVQSCLVEREWTARRIDVPMGKPASTGRGYYLCLPRSRTPTRAVQAFVEWVTAQARASAPPWDQFASAPIPSAR
ncbi:MAG: LysR family transcriptional regulator [Burkholderiaceae bacterium]|nr:LysR family transcriptional regulator [Burkholderiaceae bacterium]